MAFNSSINADGQTIYRWQVGPSTFTANPNCGGRLMAWTLNLAASKSRAVLYWPETVDWKQPEKIRGGNPLLFPFVARTFAGEKEGFWQLKGEPVRPMPRHGFARAGHFELEDIDAQGFTARLCPTDKDYLAYPFRYAFRVHYQFEDIALNVSLSLENQGDAKIPWCAGNHFYFTLPWHPGLTRDSYLMSLPAKKAFYHTPTGALTSAGKPESEISLSNPALLDRLHTRLTRPTCTFGPKSGEEPVTLTIGNGPIPSPWTTLTTWTESTNSPFYCIEPWMGPPNTPGHGQGLHWVEPGTTEVFTVRISL